MKIIQQQAQAKFKHFNSLCFGGILPEVPINLTKATTFLGRMCYKKEHRPGCAPVHRDFQIRLSSSFDLPEAEWDSVIVHEMIHLYIASNNLKDTSTHGKIFRKMMEELNKSHGLHIVISHRQAPGTLSPRLSRKRIHYICVSTFPDGQKGITVCSAEMASRINRGLPQVYKIVSRKWYVSGDIFFNHYPHSRLPRIYKISPEDLREHLASAVSLE